MIEILVYSVVRSVASFKILTKNCQKCALLYTPAVMDTTDYFSNCPPYAVYLFDYIFFAAVFIITFFSNFQWICNNNYVYVFRLRSNKLKKLPWRRIIFMRNFLMYVCMCNGIRTFFPKFRNHYCYIPGTCVNRNSLLPYSNIYYKIYLGTIFKPAASRKCCFSTRSKWKQNGSGGK